MALILNVEGCLTCPDCEAARVRPLSGRYHFACLNCCVRLVLSASPDRGLAAGHLAAIERSTGAPERAEILHEVSLRQRVPQGASLLA